MSLTGHESWAQVGIMDPEDIKSLDSAEGVALAEEQSENNSSNSDIVHVEREDAELLEEGGETVEEAELQSSVLSMLGSESELAAIREEVLSEPVVSVGQPNVLTEIPPKVRDDPPPASVEKETPVHHAAAVTSFPVPEPELQFQPELVPAPVEPQSTSIIKEPVLKTLEKEVLPGAEQKATSSAQDLPVSTSTESPVQTKSVPQPDSSDLPVLLYGGAAALVAIAAVLACAVLAYRKK